MSEHTLQSSRSSGLRGLFVTAVGTGIGKTLATTILCHQLKAQGRRVLGLKPILSGFRPDDPCNDPALILRSLGEFPTADAIAAIAPWRFSRPVSPHLAARSEGQTLTIDAVARFCNDSHRKHGGIVLIEGAGGLMTPLNEEYTFLDLIVRLGYPTVLVTGTYLGALSHTLTALFVLRAYKVRVRAIVVSESGDSVGLIETLESIRALGGTNMPLYSIPRLPDGLEEKWPIAPSLTGICNLEDPEDPSQQRTRLK